MGTRERDQAIRALIEVIIATRKEIAERRRRLAESIVKSGRLEAAAPVVADRGSAAPAVIAHCRGCHHRARRS